MSGFTFGGAGSNTGSSGSSTPSFGGPSFGQTQQPQQGGQQQQPQGFSFGAQAQTPAKPSPFGSAGSTTPAAPPPSNTFSFGASNTLGSSTAPASTTPAAPAPSGLSGFGGFGKPADKPSTPGASGAGMFGGASGAFGSTQQSAGGLFGTPKPASTTPSTTPAPAPAPASGGFSLGGMGLGGNSTQPKEKKEEAPKPSGFSFGGLGMGSSASKPEEKKDEAQAPKPSLFGGGAGAFGSAPSTSTQAPAPKPAGSFGLGGAGTFGKPEEKKEEASKPPASGGFSFGGTGNTFGSKTEENKDKGKALEAAPAPPAPSTGGFSFGNLGGGDKKDEKKEEAPKPAGGFSFGGLGGAGAGASAANSAEEKKEAAKPAAPASGGFSFGGASTSANAAKPSETAPSFKLGGENKDTNDPLSVSALGKQTTPGSTSAVKASPTPSLLRNKTLDEITQRWTGELESQQKEFSKIGQEVKAWDGVLRQNAEQISRIYNQTLQAEQSQSAVDQSLDYIEAQQRELDVVLSKYERETEELFDGGENVGLGVGVADNERSKSYTLAENVNDELDDLSRNLSTMIDEINLLSGGVGVGAKEETTKQEDVIGQIAAILNAHLSSLQWIDGTSNNLMERVKELDGVVGGIQSKKEYDGGLSKSTNTLPRRGGFGMSLLN